jgi:tRNA(Ile)-lysidine synthase
MTGFGGRSFGPPPRSSRAKSRDRAQSLVQGSDTSADGQVTRFAADLRALVAAEARVGLAVSGGPDSLALLVLAHRADPGRFEVATVDHGLRLDSAAEAEAVAAVCARLAIPHAILRPTVAPDGNLQANARAARYAVLGEWAEARGLAAIVTAHHADDQAETLLMRLNRGAGPRGLAAMRGAAIVPGHPTLPLLRPLLGWRKAELERVVGDAGLVPALDPANRDARFERARVRAALAEADWLDPTALAASARHLGDALEALDWAADREFAEAVRIAEGTATYRPCAPRTIRIEVLARLIARLGSEGTPRGAEIARLLDTLEHGGVATLGGVRADARRAGAWRLTPAPPRARR